MKPAGIIGIILIVIGIVALAWGGITYTKREKVLDLGPIQATAEKQKTIPFPPILGGICLVGGIVLVVQRIERWAIGQRRAIRNHSRRLAASRRRLFCTAYGRTTRSAVGRFFSLLSAPRKFCCLCGQDKGVRRVSDRLY